MSSAARNASAPIPVARVLKQGDYFLCGICRKAHRTKEEGNACVNTCFVGFTSGNLVIIARQFGRDVFKCKLCTRTYVQQDACQACTQDCLNRMQVKLPPMPQRLANGTYISQPNAPRKARPVMRAVATPVAAPRLVAKPVVVASAAVAAPDVQSTVEAVAEATPTPEAPAAKRPPRDRTKKFHRDGAKYVCQECSQKFFTKVEVETCFDGHPD